VSLAEGKTSVSLVKDKKAGRGGQKKTNPFIHHPMPIFLHGVAVVETIPSAGPYFHAVVVAAT
jgi:hypothetical protein